MSETLRDFIRRDEKFDLDTVARALAAHSDLGDELDAALSALVWRKRNRNRAGVTGAITHADCLCRIDRLEADLTRLDAPEAAAAAKELRSALPAHAASNPGAVFDTLEVNPSISRRARQVDPGLEGLGGKIRTYLHEHAEQLSEIPLPSGRRGLLGYLLKGHA